MRRSMGILTGVLSAFLAANLSLAAGPPEPKVEYSADMSMHAADGHLAAKVYAARGKERRDIDLQGDTSIQIMRFDQNVQWVLMPDQRMYMESPVSREDSILSPVSMERDEMKRVGDEKVNGIKATKYRIDNREASGESYEGLIWVTEDDITVKFDIKGGMPGQRGTFTMELSNLKIGTQDPQLFEIPSGYTKLDMGNMMREMMKDMPSRRPR